MNRSVADAMNSLGMLLTYKNDYASAEMLLRGNLAIRMKLDGEDHLLTASAVNNLGCALLESGNREEAESLCLKALEIRQRLVGPEHPLIALSLNTVGTILRDGGHYDRAVRYLRQSAEMHRKFVGNKGEAVAYPLVNLAVLHLTTGDLPEAELKAREALSILSMKYPGDHWLKAWAMSALGACWSRLERYSEAEPLLIASYEVLGARRKRASITQDALARVVSHYRRCAMKDKVQEYQQRR